jgi:hypothetical protein
VLGELEGFSSRGKKVEGQGLEDEGMMEGE